MPKIFFIVNKEVRTVQVFSKKEKKITRSGRYQDSNRTSYVF